MNFRIVVDQIKLILNSGASNRVKRSESALDVVLV